MKRDKLPTFKVGDLVKINIYENLPIGLVISSGYEAISIPGGNNYLVYDVMVDKDVDKYYSHELEGVNNEI